MWSSSRRALIKGIPALLLGSVLGHTSQARAASARKRLVLLMQTNGTQPGKFWPSPGTFNSEILQPLLQHERLAARTLVVKNVFVPRDAFGTDGNEHDMGFARMFTGAPLVNVAGHPWGGASSVDQQVARAFDGESLALRVVSSSVEPFPKVGYQHRNSFVYSGPAEHKVPISDPYDAFEKLFVDPFAISRAQKQRLLALRKSILDASTRQLGELRQKLGAAERNKLDQHATAIRELESRLLTQRANDRHPGASCPHKPAAPREFSKLAPDLLVRDESAVPEMITNMTDLIAASFACNLTRVATLQLGYAGHKWRFDWLGIGVNIHDEVAHYDTTDEQPNPIVIERLVKANRYYAEQVAALANKLDAIPEADGSGTLLDNTLIVWANELGRGNHTLDNIPIVMIGGAGAGLPAGGRLIDAGRQPFQRLGCTILNAMGIPAAGFGDAPDCGVFQGL